MKSLFAIKIWSEYLLSHGYSVRTIERYERESKAFFRWVFDHTGIDDIRDVDSKTIKLFFSYMSGKQKEDETLKYSESTRKGYAASIGRLFRFLFRQDLIVSNPFNSISFTVVKRYHLAKSIPLEKINAMLNSIDDSTYAGNRDRAIFECMYGTGMRVGEIVNLNISDVDFASHTILIREGKGKKDRIVPMGSNLAECLRLHLTVFRPKKAGKKNRKEITAFFLTNRGTHMNRSLINNQLKRHFAKVGETKITSHMLRHSFATHILERGAKLLQVKELLGHASMDTTTIYTNFSESSLRKIMKKYHPRETDLYSQITPEMKAYYTKVLTS